MAGAAVVCGFDAGTVNVTTIGAPLPDSSTDDEYRSCLIVCLSCVVSLFVIF